MLTVESSACGLSQVLLLSTVSPPHRNKWLQGNEEEEGRDSRTTTMRKLKEFIKNYSRPGASGSGFTFPYR